MGKTGIMFRSRPARRRARARMEAGAYERGRRLRRSMQYTDAEAMLKAWGFIVFSSYQGG
ncbi:MAG TPA: hypothetical protein DDW67_09015 [Elusimicrobia bacterium]|nr:hypothetical protein [Elusimicrobiota bacterium]